MKNTKYECQHLWVTEKKKMVWISDFSTGLYIKMYASGLNSEACCVPQRYWEASPNNLLGASGWKESATKTSEPSLRSAALNNTIPTRKPSGALILSF